MSDFPIALNNLPAEVLVYVFGFLTIPELSGISVVCKKWFRLSGDNSLWRRVYYRDYDIDPTKQRITTPWKSEAPFKPVVLKRLLSERNWKTGRESHVIKTPETSELSLYNSRVWAVHFDDTRVITGDTAYNIIVWDRDLSYRKAMRCKSREIRYLRFQDNYLATATYGGNLYIWDIDKGEVQQVLTHGSDVYCLQFDDATLVSSSRDRNVHIWDKETGVERQVLEGHTYCVRGCAFDGPSVLSGGEDCTAKLWDLRKPDPLVFSFSGHTKKITTVKFDGRRLLTGGFDCCVREWDWRTFKQVRKFDFVEDGREEDFERRTRLRGCSGGVWQMEFDEHKLVTSHQNEKVCVWDMLTGALCTVLHNHAGAVISLHMDGDFLVTGAEDSAIVAYTFGEEGSP